jgi:hypothetical protein
MTIYTVHEPPRRGDDPSKHTARFTFVRDGFYAWAFLLAPLWMLWRRLWLACFIYILLMGIVDAALAAARFSGLTIGAVNLLVMLLVGLEASSLRRWTLARRGWRMVGVVSAGSEQEAERRFFDGWVARPEPASPSDAPPVAPPVSGLRRGDATPAVIGLFPEPGART